MAYSHTRLSNNRSVMPLDVRGRTRATLKESAGLSWSGMTGQPVESPSYLEPWRVISHVNEESLVSANHELVLITSLPFVHTARRYYRLNGPVRTSDWFRAYQTLRGVRYAPVTEKTPKLDCLEKVKVVTRFP